MELFIFARFHARQGEAEAVAFGADLEGVDDGGRGRREAAAHIGGVVRGGAGAEGPFLELVLGGARRSFEILDREAGRFEEIGRAHV